MSEMKLISVCSHPEYSTVLYQSAKKHGWDIAIAVDTPWKGFGAKIMTTVEYLKANPEIVDFVFCDAFDVVVMGTPDEFRSKLRPEDKFVCSAEKGLWPPILQPFRSQYTEHEGGFNYINSGCYYATRELFLNMVSFYPPFNEIDDQYWLNLCWLFEGNKNFRMDNAQELFNSHSFIAEGEYGYDNNRVQILGNQPVFVHSNAKTSDPQLDEIIKEHI